MRIIKLNVETEKCVQSDKHFNVDAVVNGNTVEKLECRIGSCVGYPRYQRFFLACDGELRFVGRRPTRVRLKAEDMSS